MKIILIAPSGGGKGSVAEFLVKDYMIPHISTGEIFRKNITEGTPLGLQAREYVNNGIFCPDDITVRMLIERINQPDCTAGFILDGFPRTMNQAELLAELVDIDVVVQMDVSDEEVKFRLTNRIMCSKCNTIHNKRWGEVKECRECDGTSFYQREDDTIERIEKRLAEYKRDIKEILQFYKELDKLEIVEVKPEFMPVDNYVHVKEALRARGLIQ
jgi:adenylate kinase